LTDPLPEMPPNIMTYKTETMLTLNGDKVAGK